MIVRRWNPDNPSNMEATLDDEEQKIMEEAFAKTQLKETVKGLRLGRSYKCVKCGCTEADCSQCIEKTGEPCRWVAPGKCSACFKDNGELQ